jgi:hypothetical protein
LHTDEDSFNGECEWADAEDARPGELTDGMAISCDCVELGPGWWLDTYFGWYFVYDPEFVARSLAGDHSWVQPFLDANKRPKAKPGPAPNPPGLSHHLLPKEGRAHLKTEEVVARLRGEFAFFRAFPQQRPGESGAMIPTVMEQETPWAAIEAAVAGRDYTFSVVLADEMDTLTYLSFEVRPDDGIVIGCRDEQHQIAVGPLVERSARLLDYDVFVRSPLRDVAGPGAADDRR